MRRNERVFVFGGRAGEAVIANFNNWKKVCPATGDVWARVLRGVAGCGLWVIRMLPYRGPEEALLAHLAERGVGRHRVAVTDMLPAATHLVDKGRQVLRLDAQRQVLRLDAQRQVLRLDAQRQVPRLDAQRQVLRLDAQRRVLRLDAQRRVHGYRVSSSACRLMPAATSSAGARRRRAPADIWEARIYSVGGRPPAATDARALLEWAAALAGRGGGAEHGRRYISRYTGGGVYTSGYTGGSRWCSGRETPGPCRLGAMGRVTPDGLADRVSLDAVTGVGEVTDRCRLGRAGRQVDSLTQTGARDPPGSRVSVPWGRLSCLARLRVSRSLARSTKPGFVSLSRPPAPCV